MNSLLTPPFSPAQTSAAVQGDAEETAGLHHIVLRLRLPGGSSCPVLFKELGGCTRQDADAARWARDLQGSNSANEIRRKVATLGLFHDFWIEAWDALAPTPDELPTLIWSYISVRYLGTYHAEWDESVKRLGWKPVAYSTVRSEFKVIVDYYRYLARFSQGGRRLNEQLLARLGTDTQLRQRDFFVHLGAHRESWRQKFGHVARMPNIGVRSLSVRSRTDGLDRTMDEAELAALIRAETNPLLKAIWALCGYGGPRISEVLHMWQDDTLPGDSARHLFPWAASDPISVIIAHPSESRYTGDLTRTDRTRLQRLSERYGLVPRNHMKGRQRVGWKGCELGNGDLHIAPIFWLPGGAEIFSSLMEEVRWFHRLHQTGRNHPWLWVNTGTGAHFGSPMTVANVRKAFESRLRRLGLEPGRNGRRLHGLRHHYKAELTRLRVEPENIRVCMRHRSMLSQDDYGRVARDAHQALTDVVTRRDPIV